MNPYYAYGKPGDILLFPNAPDKGNDYLKGLLLNTNYIALNIAPNPVPGVAL